MEPFASRYQKGNNNTDGQGIELIGLEKLFRYLVRRSVGSSQLNSVFQILCILFKYKV